MELFPFHQTHHARTNATESEVPACLKGLRLFFSADASLPANLAKMHIQVGTSEHACLRSVLPVR